MDIHVKRISTITVLILRTNIRSSFRFFYRNRNISVFGAFYHSTLTFHENTFQKSVKAFFDTLTITTTTIPWAAPLSVLIRSTWNFPGCSPLVRAHLWVFYPNIFRNDNLNLVLRTSFCWTFRTHDPPFSTRIDTAAPSCIGYSERSTLIKKRKGTRFRVCFIHLTSHVARSNESTS